jgi:hypothetical protein
VEGTAWHRLPELTERTILMLKKANPNWGCHRGWLGGLGLIVKAEYQVLFFSRLPVGSNAFPASAAGLHARYVTASRPTSTKIWRAFKSTSHMTTSGSFFAFTRVCPRTVVNGGRNVVAAGYQMQLVFNYSGKDQNLITTREGARSVEFDFAATRRSIESVRPGMEVIEISARTGQGMENWPAIFEERLTHFSERPACQCLHEPTRVP